VLRNSADIRVAVLTAGRDRPYALGIAYALIGQGLPIDYIGGDAVNDPNLFQSPLVKSFSLRDQRQDAGAVQKIWRIIAYYLALISYTCTTRTKIFHILWNNKFEFLDRTALMLFYKLLGKRVVFTAHNVNAGQRDGKDSFLNRWSLRMQYRLADHIFVHTAQMKAQLLQDFSVPADKVTVIPFGINNTLPTTALTPAEARQRLGIIPKEKTLLFFGNIAPYKGLEHLVAALGILSKDDNFYRLIIAGKPKGSEDYWARIQGEIVRLGLQGRVIEKVEYIPDEQVELYFKAADVFVLPYNHIFQSGVLFLGYSFGLPVVSTDVGSLKEEIVIGQTGFICRPQDPQDMARSLAEYFGSDLYLQLGRRREEIRQYANDRYSWNKVGEITRKVYSSLLETECSRDSLDNPNVVKGAQVNKVNVRP
jgi:D-inositol-3-phosphate glycosyltransferase